MLVCISKCMCVYRIGFGYKPSGSYRDGGTEAGGVAVGNEG